MSVPTPDDLAARLGALQAEALRDRAARLATCCTPGALHRGLRRAVAAARHWARHGSLAVERPCCPWPV